MKLRKLEELALLDLRKCNTIDEIVTAMGKCSFGARMLGEVTDTLHRIIEKNEFLCIVYDGKKDTPLANTLKSMETTFMASTISSEDFRLFKKYLNVKNALVVGRFPERYEDNIFASDARTIFINQERIAKPGQIIDGYFPDAVFTDPNYAVPLIWCALQERLKGKKTTIPQFIENLNQYAGLAREVHDGAKNFKKMVVDKECTKFFTMSGAMTVAQMGLIVVDMMDLGMVDAYTTTGAAMAHGLVESMGLKHYKHHPGIDDTTLAQRGLNRVTDTYEPETNFDHIDKVMGAVLDSLPRDRVIAPSELHREIGKYLAEHYPNERGILKSAYEKNIPVFVPAFWDSELGNDVFTYNLKQKAEGKSPVKIDLEPDDQKLIDVVQVSKKTGIFTVGGGVPRNWTQNVGPLIELAKNRTSLNLVERPFSYGTRICPDYADLGHLSGCTYEEGKSWRKMDPRGSFVEVHGDATLIWPLIVKYAME